METSEGKDLAKAAKAMKEENSSHRDAETQSFEVS